MPRELRKRARLAVFQAWIDDSGKDAPQSPVYVLAGYSARKAVWEDFADEWQDELDQSPKLAYLKASEAYNLQGQFGFDKITQTDSEWVRVHGKGNHDAAEKRLSNFVKIIAKHLKSPDDYGITWMLKHDEYQATIGRLKSLKTASIKDVREIERHIRNPYYLSFQRILGIELTLRAAQAILLRKHETTEILFDEDIDHKPNLEKAFKEFLDVIKLDTPTWVDFLQNKRPEYRNDKCFPPLQAADLLAWHLRRMCLEISRGATKYDDPIWLQLHENSGIHYYDYRYQVADWERILTRVRVNALAALGVWVPFPK